jgi:hypothetical protein
LYRKHGSNTSKDLNITIENFEFFIQQYVAEGEIKQEEYKKIQILIAMMKSFNNIKNKEYKKIFDNVIVCFKLSRKDTIYM